MKKLLSLLLLSALFIFSCGNKSETKKEQGTAGTKEKSELKKRGFSLLSHLSIFKGKCNDCD